MSNQTHHLCTCQQQRWEFMVPSLMVYFIFVYIPLNEPSPEFLYLEHSSILSARGAVERKTLKTKNRQKCKCIWLNNKKLKF